MKAINSGDEAGRKRGVPEGMSLGMSWFCLSLCPACPSLQCPGQVTGSPCGEPMGTRYCFGHHHPLQGRCCPCAHCPECVLVLDSWENLWENHRKCWTEISSLGSQTGRDEAPGGTWTLLGGGYCGLVWAGSSA